MAVADDENAQRDEAFWQSLTAEDLRRFFAVPPQGPISGDEDAARDATGTCPAAVLVPVVVRPEGLTLLLTRRAEHLHHHPGQISFPGGRVEAADGSPVETALRETREEIGLQQRHIELLGELPQYITSTGFSIRPVIGLVHPPFTLELDAFEVAEVFEAPLAFVLDPANRQRYSMVYEGRTRHFHAMPWRGHFIWGATAGMLVTLSSALCDGLQRPQQKDSTA